MIGWQYVRESELNPSDKTLFYRGAVPMDSRATGNKKRTRFSDCCTRGGQNESLEVCRL